MRKSGLLSEEQQGAVAGVAAGFEVEVIDMMVVVLATGLSSDFQCSFRGEPGHRGRPLVAAPLSRSFHDF